MKEFRSCCGDLLGYLMCVAWNLHMLSSYFSANVVCTSAEELVKLSFIIIESAAKE